MNATKHGIFSRSLDLPTARAGRGLSLPGLDGSAVDAIAGAVPMLREISQIHCRLARVVAFESYCTQVPADLERNAPLIHRYDRMLAKQLHASIRDFIGS